MRTKPFKYTIDYGFGEPEEHTLFLSTEEYQMSGSLAVEVYEIPADGGEPEYFDTITVALPDSMFIEGEDMAFIDTNNCSWAVKMLKKMKLAKETGDWSRSGFCIYPLYKFNLDKFTEE
jgi:hypothetical protein